MVPFLRLFKWLQLSIMNITWKFSWIWRGCKLIDFTYRGFQYWGFLSVCVFTFTDFSKKSKETWNVFRVLSSVSSASVSSFNVSSCTIQFSLLICLHWLHDSNSGCKFHYRYRHVIEKICKSKEPNPCDPYYMGLTINSPCLFWLKRTRGQYAIDLCFLFESPYVYIPLINLHQTCKSVISFLYRFVIM